MPSRARGARRRRWLPSFGGFGGRGLPAAVVPFSVRTLLRSPQHRVILAFYLGMGFAAAIFFMNLSAPKADRRSDRGAARGGIAPPIGRGTRKRAGCSRRAS